MDGIVASMSALALGLRPAVVVEATGHRFPQERPRKFDAALPEFLGGL